MARQPQRLARFTAAISSRVAQSCPYTVDVSAEATRSNRASQSHSARMPVSLHRKGRSATNAHVLRAPRNLIKHLGSGTQYNARR